MNNGWLLPPVALFPLDLDREMARRHAPSVCSSSAQQSLLDALLVIGSNRLLLSVDWPFEDISDATDWFEGVLLSHADKQKIGRENALKLMKIVP